MKQLVLLTVILTHTLTLTGARADESGQSKRRGFFHQVGRDAIAPSRVPKILLWGSVATGATYLLKFTNFQTHMAREKYLGSLSKWGYRLGYPGPNATYAVGALIYGLAASEEATKDRAFDASLLMFRATVFTSATTEGIKHLRFEERPRGGDFKSFPSGHASNAFTFAGVIHRLHGVYWGAGAYSMATLVALSRVNDNAHYLHDVVFGATIGLGYAFGLDPMIVQVIPGKQPGVQVTLNF